LIKRFSFDVFHGDELRAFQLSQFIDMDDIRTIERRCGLGFLDKATLQGRPLFPAATTSAQGSIQVQIAGFIHDTHTAFAEFPDHLVMRNGSANHRGST
jgi:hypothetical protein